MARIEYQRVDFILHIRAEDENRFSVTWEREDGSQKSKRYFRWELDVRRLMPDLFYDNDFHRELEQWRERYSKASHSENIRVIPRIALDIEDIHLAIFPWEFLLVRLLQENERIVRVSPIRPRALNIPFTLPWRLCHIDPRGGSSLRETLGQRFPELLVQFKKMSCEDLAASHPNQEWPTMDVLYFDGTPWSEERQDLLSTADPEQALTLGWLSRLTERWQTRLVILRSDIERFGHNYWPSSSLGAALIARGGPAILVIPDWFIFVEEYDQEIMAQLIKGILNDQPLDLIFSSKIFRRRPWYPFWYSLHLGAGREDLLRASAIATQIAQPELQSRLITETVRRSRSRPLALDADATPLDAQAVRRTLDSFLETSRAIDWEQPEGISSFADELKGVRNKILPDSEPISVDLISSRRRSPSEKRHTHCSLWKSGEGNELFLIDKKLGRLKVGQTYHLRIGISADDQDEWAKIIGSTALFEEVFKWSEGKNEVWLEVAVTGIDFDILGDPVQELRLGRTGPTEPLHFAVRPRTPGAARLRVCIYYKNAVIQSLRVVATVLAQGAEDPSHEARTQAMAAALDVGINQVEDTSIAVRMEYGEMPALSDIERRHPRALSIVANDAGGKPVFSIKGAGDFLVVVDENIPHYVNNIRDTLAKISTKGADPTNSKAEQYAFGFAGDRNAGTEKDLKEALNLLATYGRQLYQAILVGKNRNKVQKALEAGDQTIEIAHLLLEKVIPWPILYDGKCNAPADKRTVCFAPIEGGPKTRCREHPSCVLRTQNLNESAVVCPRHFWGFRHRIELPIQRRWEDDEQAKSGRVDEIHCGEPAKMLIALNRTLRRANTHADQLEVIVSKLASGMELKPLVDKRDEIISALEDGELDIVYFYCHAMEHDNNQRFDPNLVFQLDVSASEERITHTDLGDGAIWEHRPLVFLNACRTGGFSSNALSPFLKALVADRGAAGVVSTEVDVWEQLSTEFAELFMEAFLKGTPAADAMLEARWALLKRKNPLGLVYTLYASADLKLAVRSGSKH